MELDSARNPTTLWTKSIEMFYFIWTFPKKVPQNSPDVVLHPLDYDILP